MNACKTQEERKRTEALIKPILRGKDIKRYAYEWADLWVIFIPWHFPNTNNPKNMEENEQDFSIHYPIIYSHLLSHKDKLLKRNKDETEKDTNGIVCKDGRQIIIKNLKKRKLCMVRSCKSHDFI